MQLCDMTVLLHSAAHCMHTVDNVMFPLILLLQFNHHDHYMLEAVLLQAALLCRLV
jgi:hypothetical protein